MKITGSFRKGIGFGLVSGIITTLGLLIGLFSSTQSKLVVIAGILSIAIADSLSDALGQHISEEFSNKHTTKYLWSITLSTFFTKFLFALAFLIPIYVFSLKNAIIFSSIIGILLILIFSYMIALEQNENPYNVILEHVSLTIVVIFLTYLVGSLIHFIV